MVNVLSITGSPRPHGHTAALLAAFVEGAETAGALVDHIDACKANISGCSGCMACAKTGECVFKDDMQSIWQRLGQADVIILTSPLYFMGVSGQLKLLIDRCQTCWSRRYLLRTPALLPEKHRQGFFLATGGAPNKKGTNFDPAIQTAAFFFDALEADYAGEIVVANTDHLPVHEQPELLAKAKASGSKLVKEALA